MTLMSLKDALHQDIHGAVPIKRLADDLGISYSYLANAGNPNLDEFNFQLKHLIPLMKATGSTAVLDYLEHNVGRVAFRIPEASGVNVSVTAELFEIVRHVGELAGQIEHALADNVVEKREVKGIEPLLFDLAKHAMCMLKTLTEVAK